MQCTLVSHPDQKAFQLELNSSLKIIEKADTVTDVQFSTLAVGYPERAMFVYSALILHEGTQSAVPSEDANVTPIITKEQMA